MATLHTCWSINCMQKLIDIEPTHIYSEREREKSSTTNGKKIVYKTKICFLSGHQTKTMLSLHSPIPMHTRTLIMGICVICVCPQREIQSNLQIKWERTEIKETTIKKYIKIKMHKNWRSNQKTKNGSLSLS